MTPYDITPSQLAWQVATQGNLTPTDKGVCRLCGGKLVGEYQLHRTYNSKTWMDEFRTVARYADYICAGCDWSKKNRNLFMQLKTALLISPEIGWLNYGKEQIDQFLSVAAGLKYPYIVIIKQSFGVYKKHFIFDAAVSWGEPAYITVLKGQDSFTVPLKLSRLSYALTYLENKYGGKRLEKKAAYTLLRQNDFLWELAFSFYVQKHYGKKER